LITGLILLVILPCAAPCGQEQQQVRIAFFEGGESLGHMALTDEYLRQLRQMLPDDIEPATIPRGYKSAGWKRDTCRAMAARLASIEELDLVVTTGPWVVEDLLAAGFKKPIVAMNRVDPMREGLLDEAGRPVVPNLTVHRRPHKLERDLVALTQLVDVKRLGLLYFPTGNERDSLLAQVSELGRKLGFEVVSHEGYNKYGTFAYFKAYHSLDKNIDALYLFPFWDMDAIKTREFLAMVKRDGIPAFVWEGRFLVDRGAFASNAGYTVVAEARFAAARTVRILKGEIPAGLPVDFDTPGGLTLNRETADRCRLHLNEETLREAQVIPAPPPEDAPVLTIRGVIQQALDRNPGHLSRYDALEEAAQAARQAYGAYLPEVIGEYTVANFDDDFATVVEESNQAARYTGRLTLEQTVFSLETIRSIEKAARRRHLQEISLEQSQLDLELAMTVAFLNLLEADQTVALQLANRNHIDRYYELAFARLETENGPQADVVRWEQERRRATAQTVTASGTLEVTRILLNSLLNLPGHNPLVLDSSRFSEESFARDYYRLLPLLDDPGSLRNMGDHLVEEALTRNRSVRYQKARIELQKSRLAGNKARYFPTVGFRATLDRFDNLSNRPPELPDGAGGWSLGATVSLPIFLGADRIRERGRLNARLSETEYLRDDAVLRVMSEVLGKLHQLTAHAGNVRRYLLAESLALENLGLVAADYEAGKATLLEMLEAQENVLEAKLTSVRSRYGYYRNLARLSSEIGWSVHDEKRDLSELFFQYIDEYIGSGR